MLCPLDHLTEEQWKNHAHAWIKWEKDFANLPDEMWQAYRVDKKGGVSHLIYVVVAGCVGERWTVQPRYFTA
jgi:hypothetical protein